MNLKHILCLVASLVCVSSISTWNIKHKKLVHNFPKTVGKINWNAVSVTVPLIQAAPAWMYPINVQDAHPPTKPEYKRSIDANQEQQIDISSDGTPTKPAKDYRYDCPFSKNFCMFTNPCNKVLERCAMNLKCSKLKCVLKRPKPTTTTAITTTPSHVYDSNNNDDGDDAVGGSLTGSQNASTDRPCPYTACNDTNPCPRDQSCTTDEACTIPVCLDKTLTSTPALPTPTQKVTESIIRNEPCPTQTTKCVHGYCQEDKLPDGRLNFYCVCDKGWIEYGCDMPCTLDCAQGVCNLDLPPDGYTPPKNVTVDMMRCNCLPGWEGNLCHEKAADLVAEEKERTMIMGLSLGCVLLVVTITSILILFVLWRKRVIVVMKLVYFFKPEEFDDGRLYDAYISMGTSIRGMDFVKDKLCPVLEDQGFNIYLQAKDQLAGELIVESIHKAMEQSRRTILIITPEYLGNEWSMFECIIAQIETLKLHQRIIPIILEDISMEKQNINKTLKHIMESVKCLKFPTVKSSETVSLKEKKRKEDKFWERLKLTMPKKKKSHVDEQATDVSDLEDVVVKTPDKMIDISSISVMYSTV